MPIYGLKINTRGQTEYYSAPEDSRIGDFALVEMDRGEVIAKFVSGPLAALPGGSEADLPVISRLAGEDDMEVFRRNEELRDEAFAFCKQCIRERNLEMKLVDVDIFFDRSKYIFYFSAPNRIDFRELVKDLVRAYRARIELRQIGVRHETQRLGAIGNCGMVCCCRGHLRKFAPVTIKMAKEQNLFLNPAKISGICGRLLCCLSYEQENYENFHRESPRIGKKYKTRQGILRVLRTNMFHNSVTILSENNEEKEIRLEEWAGLAPIRIKNDGPAKEGEITESPDSDCDVQDDEEIFEGNK